jgi:NAD(P)-dependent dehydrogenase (short-subunit alcohol dehydrogenase family)
MNEGKEDDRNTARTDSGAPRRGAVVITGASTGIGRACALSLDALGFRIFAGVRKAEGGESLRRASSARLTPIFMDVTDEQSIAAAAQSVSREVRDAGLVGLVNNAGVAIPGPLDYLPLEELSGENGYALMQLSTRAASFSWPQALKKSVCIVEAAPEERVTLPEVVGMANRTSMLRAGTRVGWVLGHCFAPSLCLTA